MFAGQKGVNTVPFQRGNSGPGIIGPGRPPVSMEYEGHMALRFMGRGFPRPVGGVVAPGGLNQNEVNVRSVLLRDLLVVFGGLLYPLMFFQRYLLSTEVIINGNHVM